jgi:hypothetical protein
MLQAKPPLLLCCILLQSASSGRGQTSFHSCHLGPGSEEGGPMAAGHFPTQAKTVSIAEPPPGRLKT